MKTPEDMRREFVALARIYGEYRKDELAGSRPVRYEVTEGEAALMHHWAPGNVPIPVAGDRFEFMGVPCIVIRDRAETNSEPCPECHGTTFCGTCWYCKGKGTASGKGLMPQRPPTENERRGMNWWNRLNKSARTFWLEEAERVTGEIPSPALAWTVFGECKQTPRNRNNHSLEEGS